MPRPPSTPQAIYELRRLRQHRALRERDLDIAGAISDLEREIKKRARATGGIGEAWHTVVPPRLAARATPVSLSRGVLTVRTADASARFELDRWLRAGGESALARAGGVAIKRIRFA